MDGGSSRLSATLHLTLEDVFREAGYDPKKKVGYVFADSERRV